MSSKESKEDLQKLQVLEQNMHQIGMQKQQFSAQLYEVEGALKEIENSDSTFKIIGGLMVSAKKDDLKSELSQKKELLELRVQTLEKQEKQLKEKAKSLQEELTKAKE